MVGEASHPNERMGSGMRFLVGLMAFIVVPLCLLPLALCAFFLLPVAPFTLPFLIPAFARKRDPHEDLVIYPVPPPPEVALRQALVHA